MPKDAALSVETPVTVVDASRAFSSPLRLQLLRFYRDHPGASQSDAVHELGVSQPSLTSNIRALVATGALVQSAGEDRRTRVYVIDETRLRELYAALGQFAVDPSITTRSD